MTYPERPVFDRLPQKGYQDNPTVSALTSWVDEKLHGTAMYLQNFYTYLDPTQTPSNLLDFLAYICGLSGVYWDTKYSDNIKRLLIAKAHYHWSFRGSIAVIRSLLDIHAITYNIWLKSSLKLTFKLSGTFGRDDLTFYIRLPLMYQRVSREFREAERILRNYAPVITKNRVVYKKFYLGFSRIGEPLFTD